MGGLDIIPNYRMTQSTLDGTCAHMHIGDCTSLVIGGCNVCLDCGEHNVEGGLGYKYLPDNSIEKYQYYTKKEKNI